VSPARTLAQCASIADLQRLAQRRLPGPAYHYLEGGADDECTLRRNVDAFDDYELWPTYLKDIGTVDLSASLLGRRIGVPFFLAPTGLSRLFHHEKEPAVARAAQEFGTYYTLSTMGTTSIEAIGELGAGPWMFQIYILKDRGLTREFVERCRAARYHALCLTVDTQVGGNRERDRVTGMVAPPKLTAASLASFALHPRWSWQYLRHPGFTFANVAHRVDDARHSMSVMNFINSQFDRALTWADVEWLVREWNGPLVITGSWVYPLLTVHLPHKDYGDTPLTQTHTLRGRLIPALFLELTYHLEHHLYPQVPSHRLPELSRRLEPFFRQADVRPWRVP
jgi:L-lactate dehydrogenase (cytochrome)